jgi:NAD(P)-dependent dehydrogenase (short-subunit alcohol dehydrogenase family)
MIAYHANQMDLLVLGGGIQRRTPAENFPDQDWDDVLQVNLNAVWVIARDAGRHMLESRGGVSGGDPVEEGAADRNPRGRGKIINVSSLVSFQGKLISNYEVQLTNHTACHFLQAALPFPPTPPPNTESSVSPKPSPTNGHPRESTSTVSHQDTSQQK